MPGLVPQAGACIRAQGGATPGSRADGTRHGASAPACSRHLSLPQISLDHLRILLDLAGRPDGDRLAVVDHLNRLADAHHDLHVVLDEQDRDLELVAQPADEPHEVERLPAGSCRRPARRAGAASVRSPARAQSRAGAGCRTAGSSRLVRRRRRGRRSSAASSPARHLALLRVVAAGPEHGIGEHLTGPQVMRRQHVLEHGHVGEQADVLERPRDAELRDLIRLLAVDARPVEMDFAFGRLVQARQQVEDRRLARAVRADQAVQRAAARR